MKDMDFMAVKAKIQAERKRKEARRASYRNSTTGYGLDGTIVFGGYGSSDNSDNCSSDSSSTGSDYSSGSCDY